MKKQTEIREDMTDDQIDQILGATSVSKTEDALEWLRKNKMAGFRFGVLVAREEGKGSFGQVVSGIRELTRRS